MSTSYDLLIRGGTVVDGTGAPSYVADVAVKDGRIAVVGKDIPGTAKNVIDAKGLMVTPGFVDIHTHYDGQVTWEHTLTPSSLHGVTTVVMGNCGVGFAPCRPDQRQLLIEVMEGVEDIPGIVMNEGVPWEWETFPEYLDYLDKRHSDIDFATQVPHAAARVYVMGKRGADREPANAEDIRKMAQLVQEGVKAGALGFSTARASVHRTKAGVLAPTITAGEEELRGIAMGLKEIDMGVIEAVDDFTDINEDNCTDLDMWRRIVRASGRPLSFALVQANRMNVRWPWLLRFLRETNEEGLPIRGQVVNRPVGLLLGLDLSSHPFMACKSYKEIAHLPLHERTKRMSDPALRAKLLAEAPGEITPELGYLVCRVDDMVELTDPINYFPPADQTLAARAKARGITPQELAYELLLKNEGHNVLYHPVANLSNQGHGVTREMLTHPYTVPGLGDGGAHLGVICDASMSTHMLTYWTRDTDEASRLPVEFAVKALTSSSAEAVGLNDRGIVKPGYKADLNVIDYKRLAIHLPRMVQDLPAGGRRLKQRADGYIATIVSGTVTYREGVATGELPGRLVRGAKPAPVEAR